MKVNFMIYFLLNTKDFLFPAMPCECLRESGSLTGRVCMIDVILDNLAPDLK